MPTLCLSGIIKNSGFIKRPGSYAVVVSLVAYIGTNNTANYRDLTQIVLGFTTKKLEKIYKIYPISLESDFYQDLEIICGDESYLEEDFNTFSILGKQVTLDVVINNDQGRSYTVIDEIYPLTTPFEAKNIKLVKFSHDYIDELNDIPQWICKFIKSSKEWKMKYPV